MFGLLARAKLFSLIYGLNEYKLSYLGSKTRLCLDFKYNYSPGLYGKVFLGLNGYDKLLVINY